MRSVYRDGPSLRQVQEAMASRISGPLSASLDGAGPQRVDWLVDWLYVPTPARTGERLRVYTSGYPARVHDSLAETYPALARVVGAPAFEALAHRYAGSMPLTSYNLNDAGAQMSAFLRQDSVIRDRPFLPDLAELEWRVARAFHAAERPALDPSTLPWTVDDWADAVLHFQPSVALVSSAWPLLDLWAGTDLNPWWQASVPAGPEDIVVRRAGLVVRCESVTADEAFALRLLLDGRCLGESMEQLEAEGHDPGAVSEWFSRWTSTGMIADAVRPARHGDRH